MSFAIIVGSYDVSPPLSLSRVLAMRICGDNGISRDPLDVCIGDQLVSSVTSGTYA